MKTITIRGIDDQIATLLKEKAHQEQKSMNQLLLETIRKSLGLTHKKRFTMEYHDLDHLFGQWNEEEFIRIESVIDRERKIDEELWR